CADRVSTSLERRASADGHRAPLWSQGVMRSIAVLGAGSWGTALSVHLGKQGHQVRLWGRDRRLVDEMRVRRANAVYLPDVTLPRGVSVTCDLDEALDHGDLIVVTVPSHGCRTVLRAAASHLKP